jgi:hypothetical protein
MAQSLSYPVIKREIARGDKFYGRKQKIQFLSLRIK